MVGEEREREREKRWSWCLSLPDPRNMSDYSCTHSLMLHTKSRSHIHVCLSWFLLIAVDSYNHYLSPISFSPFITHSLLSLCTTWCTTSSFSPLRVFAWTRRRSGLSILTQDTTRRNKKMKANIKQCFGGQRGRRWLSKHFHWSTSLRDPDGESWFATITLVSYWSNITRQWLSLHMHAWQVIMGQWK